MKPAPFLLSSAAFLSLAAGLAAGDLRKPLPPFPSYQVPLPILPTLAPTSTDATTDYYDITMQAGVKEIVPGRKTTIWGYNGIFPGPTIVARRNRRVIVRQVNNLPESVSVHLHGGHSPSGSDGLPDDLIGPGATKTYEYPNNAIASTLWYHDHAADVTGRHVYMGLAGIYLLRDDFEDSLPLPKGKNDVALLLQDRIFSTSGALIYPLTDDTISTGVYGNVILVNGALQPYQQVGRRKVRYRIVNGSNTRIYELALSTGDPLVQIASDGGLLAAPATRPTITVAPGERVEIVIDFARYPVGTSVVLQNLNEPSFQTSIPELMRFDVVRNELDDSSVPAVLRIINRIPESSASVTRDLTLYDVYLKGRYVWTVNGNIYDPARIDANPHLNATEIWSFINDSGEPHPMHIHDIEWQILDIDGSPPPAGDDGWKDTFLVQPFSVVRVIGTFTDNVGRYVSHCHKLEHEDHAMMFNFQVDP